MKFGIRSMEGNIGKCHTVASLCRYTVQWSVHSLICLLLRRKYDLSAKVRARLLTTIPDSTSQKFVLVGSLARKDAKPEGNHVVIFLDFAGMRDRQCQDSDFEKWYARGRGGHECIMGHKVRMVRPNRTEAVVNLSILAAMVLQEKARYGLFRW